MKIAILTNGTNVDATLAACCMLHDKYVDRVVLMEDPSSMRNFVGYDKVYVIGMGRLFETIDEQIKSSIAQLGIDWSIFTQLKLCSDGMFFNGTQNDTIPLPDSNWCDGLYNFLAKGKPRPKISLINSLHKTAKTKEQQDLIANVTKLLVVGLPYIENVLEVISDFEQWYDTETLTATEPLLASIKVANSSLKAECRRLLMSSVWYENSDGAPTALIICERQRAVLLKYNIAHHLKAIHYAARFFVILSTDALISSMLVVNTGDGRTLAEVFLPCTEDAVFVDDKGTGLRLVLPKVDLPSKFGAAKDDNDKSKYGGVLN